jgi:predicted DCC family thiol-disulfide oxidoreductase YuxK
VAVARAAQAQHSARYSAMGDGASILLIWDGECGFCRNAVTWMLQQDHTARIRPVPYQELSSPPMTPKLRQQAERAVQVITPDGQQISGGQAVLFILQEVGWRPRLVRLTSRRPFLWVVEMGYWIVARNRSLFSRFLFRGQGQPGCRVENLPD